MAGQELKVTDKVVLKNSRDGAIEKNLADGSTTRVSGKPAEAVLKPTKTPEQLDKIKSAGLSPPELRKRVYTNLKFCVNNPEKPVVNDEDNQQSEQTVSAFIPPLAIKFKPKKVDEKQFGVQAIKRNRKQRICEEKAEVKEKKLAFEAEKADTAENVDISDEADVPESKMKSDKTRNTLKEHSAAAEKLTDKSDESALSFENGDVCSSYSQAVAVRSTTSRFISQSRTAKRKSQPMTRMRNMRTNKFCKPEKSSLVHSIWLQKLLGCDILN